MIAIQPLTATLTPRLAQALAPLPLLVRYGLTEAKLQSNLATALTRGDRVVVAVEGAEPLGLAHFLPSGTFAMGGYLKLIAVAPGEQTRGVGALLLAAYEEQTFATSAHAFLLVSDFNTAAQRFYERHGYQRVGALPRLVLPDVDELIYWKARPATPLHDGRDLG